MNEILSKDEIISLIKIADEFQKDFENLDKAAAAYDKALTTLEGMDGVDEEVLDVTHNYANCLAKRSNVEMGDYKKAKELFSKAIAGYKKLASFQYGNPANNFLGFLFK